MYLGVSERHKQLPNPYESPQGLDEPKPFPLLWLAKEAWMCLWMTLLVMAAILGLVVSWPISSTIMVYLSLCDAARMRTLEAWIAATMVTVPSVCGTALWTVIAMDIFFGCTFSNPW